MMKLTQHTPSIWTIDHFLDEATCQSLIARSEDKGYEAAKVNAGGKQTLLTNARNNARLFYEDEALASTYWQRLQAFCPQLETSFPVGLNERFRFYKYTPKQRFKRHRDGRFIRSQTEQSLITFLLYLNDDYQGGETWFEAVTIAPKTGTALCFFHELWHEGCAVIKGTKYALRSNVMYRTMKR